MLRPVVILTYGSRGDVEPFLALGAGLLRAGYAVRLAAPAGFAGMAAAQGLEFVPIQGDPDELAQAFADRAGQSWVRQVQVISLHVLPLAQNAFRTLQEAAQGAGLIIHSFLMTEAGHTLARRQGIPDISAQFFPVFMPTAAFSALSLPDWPLGGAFRRLTHHFNTFMFRNMGRLLYRKLRASAPDLPPLADFPFSRRLRGETPVLFAYSPQVLPKPPDWPENAHVTGYWQLPAPADWTPPEALARFLGTGPAPVYFGPGSMRSEKLQDMLRMVVAAGRAAGQRLCLGVRPEALPGESLGADVIAAQGVPHAWLFPRMRYILHHGGAGTTGAVAAAGVPSSGIPFSADQAFWARRICQLGLGPAAPPAQRLACGQLEAILQEALANPEYGRRAARLGEALRGEDGVERAIQVIQAQLEGS